MYVNISNYIDIVLFVFKKCIYNIYNFQIYILFVNIYYDVLVTFENKSQLKLYK